MLLVILALIFLAGLVVLLSGVTGRRVGDHPVCAGCEYDLSGANGGLAQCPECGAKLLDAARVRRGRLVRSPRRMAVGAMLIVTAVGGATSAIVAARRGFDLNRLLPSFVLMWNPDSDLLRTLVGRIAAKDMSESRVRSLVERAIVEEKQWGWREWGDVVEAAFASGYISREEWAEYVRGSIENPRWSARAFRGGLVSVEMDVNRLKGSTGRVTPFTLTADVTEARVNGQSAGLPIRAPVPPTRGDYGNCRLTAIWPEGFAKSGDWIETTWLFTATAANGAIVQWTVPVKTVVEE